MNQWLKCFILLIGTLLVSITVNAQTSYLKSNEKVLFSFKTASGKTLMLALDTAGKYIVYRFGTAKHVDFEYPKDSTNSFDKFKRYYYVRYGGVPNAGTEISQVEFTNEGFTYKMFEQSFSENENERYEIGVTVVDGKTNKETRINGLLKTQKGGLLGLKEDEQIKLLSGPFGH